MNYSETNRVLSWVLRDTQERLNSFLKELYIHSWTWGLGRRKQLMKTCEWLDLQEGDKHTVAAYIVWRDLSHGGLIWEDFVSRSIFKNRKYTTTLSLFSLMKPTRQNLIKYRLRLWKYSCPHSGKRSRINSLAKWNYRARKYFKNHGFRIREAILNLFVSLILMIPIIMAVI